MKTANSALDLDKNISGYLGKPVALCLAAQELSQQPPQAQSLPSLHQ